jgi:hypothetical protein
MAAKRKERLNRRGKADISVFYLVGGISKYGLKIDLAALGSEF